MHFHLPTIALFSAVALLTFSYAHVASLSPALEMRSHVPRAVPYVLRGGCRSKLIHLRAGHATTKRPSLPELLGPGLMFTQTRAASNVVTDDTTSTAVHSVLNGDAVNWAVKEMCGLLCTHCRL